MTKLAKKHFNGWKWAFIVLLAAIVISGAVVVHKATAPAPAPEVSRPVNASDTSLTVDLNRKQVNALSANYLNKFLKGQQVKYHFIVGEKYATLVGDTKFMGIKVRFALNFVPQMTKEGNVLLKAKGLSVGQLNIPLRFVMGYIAKNYNIPKWVAIDAKKKTVLLDLNRYSRHRSLKYSAQEINMADGHFRFLITVPTDN
ncbi:MAG TPA: YpmS family protein [Candidatus Limosilactobacillus intestinigallinarum]|nr:YpmS family protein [Candidatus Limosilactobacillus intestinigallinarum]